MSTLRTSYEFTLPRGYVDMHGALHSTGTMRLATARDELEPLRDPTVTGPDDPRLTILVLTRVIERLGTVDPISSHVIEGLFAVDLAFLQDFYGVINFGNQEEFDALVQAQQSSSLLGVGRAAPVSPEASVEAVEPEGTAANPPAAGGESVAERPNVRRAVEELPRRAQ